MAHPRQQRQQLWIENPCVQHNTVVRRELNELNALPTHALAAIHSLRFAVNVRNAQRSGKPQKRMPARTTRA